MHRHSTRWAHHQNQRHFRIMSYHAIPETIDLLVVLLLIIIDQVSILCVFACRYLYVNIFLEYVLNEIYMIMSQSNV